MTNKLSHSALKMYSDCNRKYYLHYKKRLRSKVISGALLFGSAIDVGLNKLLETNSLEEAKAAFDKLWLAQSINNVYTSLPKSELVVYADKDFDVDLLLLDDLKKISEDGERETVKEIVASLKDKKKQSGLNSLSKEEKEVLSYSHWLCLKQKGHVMLSSYQKKVLPHIKSVKAIQKPFKIENQDGDVITGFIDLILEWDDGNVYIFDNKTSSREYEENEATRSQQLITYYHSEKEEYDLGGVGFIVLNKNILKNKIKICKECGHDNSSTNHKSCNNQVTKLIRDKKNADTVIPKLTRCEGEFDVTCDPDCYIQIIKNSVSPEAESLVIETFDVANQGIKSEHFPPNLSSCVNGPIICPFVKYCWEGKEDDLVSLGDKK